MQLCYLEEAGDDAVIPSATAPIQPLVCVLALTINAATLRDFTLEFMDLKQRFFPGQCRNCPRLERILVEVKGADIRKAFRTAIAGHHRYRHTCVGFLDATLDLLKRFQGRVFGRVYVKQIGVPLLGVAMYTASTQDICTTFHRHLETQNDTGILIPDPRAKAQDRHVSFSIFTQKFQFAGDAYPRLMEMPVFGQSLNHAPIQVCDVLCSGLLYPIAAHTYCGHVQNVHVDPGFAFLKSRYGARLQGLLYECYDNVVKRWRGGIVVSDPVGGKHSGHLFR